MPMFAYVVRGDDRLLLDSWALGSSEWEALRRDRAKGDAEIVMACGQRGTMKRLASTQFFSHLPGATSPGCRTGETREHLHTKRAIIDGALAADWQAADEVRVPAPRRRADDSEFAIADVVAWRAGSPRAVFEVQWSQQSRERYETRHERYARAGIWAAWFVRHPGELPLADRFMPVIPFAVDGDGTPVADVHGTRLPVAEVVQRFLTGRLQHRGHHRDPAVGIQGRVRVAVVRCLRCGSGFGAWRAESPFARGRCGGEALLETERDWLVNLSEFEAGRSSEPAAIAAAHALLRALGAAPGRIESRRRLPGDEYGGGAKIHGFRCPDCSLMALPRSIRRTLDDATTRATYPAAGTAPRSPHWCLAGPAGCCALPGE